MSFESHMRPHLNPPSGTDLEFYVRGTTEALNRYMAELEVLFEEPLGRLNGTVIFPNGTTIPIVNVPAVHWKHNGIRFSLAEVKVAMWCNDGNMSFINLFNLIGQKICLNFTQVVASPYVVSPPMPVVLAPDAFATAGLQFRANLLSMGNGCTPESVLSLESSYIQQAVKMTLIVPTVMTGACILGGVFTGTAGGSFENAT